MLPVRQARTLITDYSEKVENKDGYKHKSRTDDKYWSRRDHKSQHKNKHKDERRSRKKESRGKARAMFRVLHLELKQQ
jgi:hypothetical protein